MIDDELRPIVTEFITEMLNDPCCESILLDAGKDAGVGSDQPILYMDVTGKRYGCTLNIVGGKYSVSIRNAGTNETITMVERGERAWELQGLFAEIKTRLLEDK